jgi:hypothetical protein
LLFHGDSVGETFIDFGDLHRELTAAALAILGAEVATGTKPNLALQPLVCASTS